ncbi:protein FAM8A1-like [Drosophila tropicalis]|uniref:protein FAM8A1-like n=1 Tax=Drosophila tropicalis TaxID=46794 RepID=UPI0035AC05EA
MSEPGENDTTSNNSPDPIAEVANPTPEMDAKEAYFASLREWANQMHIARFAMPIWYYPVYIWPLNMNAVTQSPQPQPQPHEGESLSMASLLNDAREPVPSPNLSTLGGYQYAVAPITKRYFAEIIDLLFMLFIKTFVLIMLINFFEMEFGRTQMQKALEEDFGMVLRSFSSDVLIIDLICVVVSCLLESVCTSGTLGHFIMKIRVFKVKTILYPHEEYELDMFDFINFQYIQPLQVLILPIETPGVMRMFVRALIKLILFLTIYESVIFASMLLVMAVVMFCNFNRCIHDVLTSTIVVERKRISVYRLQTPVVRQQLRRWRP